MIYFGKSCRESKMIRYFRILVICISLFYSFYTPYFLVKAAQSLLADKHKAAGISCEGCHKENPPKGLVPTGVCTKCHGDQAKLANRTQKVIPNPHESHLENVKCELCHHAHKSSENYCSTCHEFDYKVP
jgi:hypothetical protein